MLQRDSPHKRRGIVATGPTTCLNKLCNFLWLVTSILGNCNCWSFEILRRVTEPLLLEPYLLWFWQPLHYFCGNWLNVEIITLVYCFRRFFQARPYFLRFGKGELSTTRFGTTSDSINLLWFWNGQRYEGIHNPIIQWRS